MRKHLRKLALSRETLRHLQAPNLRQVQGAESGTCPLDCDTTTCPPPTECCNSNSCGGSVGYTCTCPPASFPDSGCWACG